MCVSQAAEAARRLCAHLLLGGLASLCVDVLSFVRPPVGLFGPSASVALEGSVHLVELIRQGLDLVVLTCFQVGEGDLVFIEELWGGVGVNIGLRVEGEGG